MANWADIPKDVATKIAEHIQHHEDFESFGEVCSRWRLAAKEASFRAAMMSSSIYLRHDHGRHRVPWLMLPEQDDSSSHRTFHSLCHRSCKLYRVSLHYSTYLLSSRGWLLCFSGFDLNLSLFNPFSGSVIQLPPFPLSYSSTEAQMICYDKFILSEDPATTSDYAVALVFSQLFPDHKCSDYSVAIWWNGDTNWVRVADRIIYRAFAYFCHDLAFYKGEFYAVDGSGQVLCLGTSKGPFIRGQDIPLSLGNVPMRVNDWNDHSMFYLVESEADDKLLVIYRGIRVRYIVKYEQEIDPLDGKKYVYEVTTKDDKEVRTYIFRAFEFDVETGDVEEVHSLGNRCVFLGLNSSFSIHPAPAHAIKPNCIYFTDAYLSIYKTRYVNRGQDVGIYNFTDNTFQDYHYHGFSPLADFAAPPMWVESPSI